MKCADCGGDFNDELGQVELDDVSIGPYSVDSVRHFLCNRCGEILLPPDAGRAVEAKREEILEARIRSRPLNDFLTSAETTALLGMTRQALHKHRRIRRGFIYQTRFGGKTVYLKESVLLYKETGDGRFPLRQDAKPLRLVEGAERAQPVKEQAEQVRMVAEKRATYGTRRKNA